ncbi:Major facilitator superfamily (MFS) profile domain-containing protein [[Candida] zeylanoides]
MGLLGTSSAEEDRLRSAADQPPVDRRQSHGSTTASSAYETADESADEHELAAAAAAPIGSAGAAAEHDDATIRAYDAAPDSAVPEVTVAVPLSHDATEQNSVEDYVVQHADTFDEDEDENALNRRFTLERIASRRTIEELAEDDFNRELSRISTHEKRGVPISELKFDSVDDKDDPFNWPAWKKWYITMTVATICLTVSLGSSLYVSGVSEIEEAFGVSQELAISGLTFYLIGLALGPLFTAPLSELVGRKWIYIISLPVSMLFTMGIGLSQNIYSILIQRFFCGLIASPALAVAGGSISDIWSPDEIGFAMAMFCLAPFLGPVLGPVVGNFAAQNKGWKWTMWVSLMFSGAALPFVLLLPETYKPIILAKRAQKRGIVLDKPTIDAAYVKYVARTTLLKPMTMLAVEPIVMIFSIYIAFVFAVLFGFFEAFPIIFISVYHMNQGVSGLPFLSIGIGLALGVVFYIVLDKLVFFPKNPDGTRGKRDENGNIIWDAPESRLIIGKVGAVCLPVSLFWLGWTSRESVHWIAPTISGAFFGFGMILVFFTVVLYFSMSFPPSSVASAIAANNLLRYILASVFPLFTVQMYERLHIDWASSLFAFIALAMVPVPFVFGRYGPRLRASSKYGYAAYFRKLAEEKAAEAAKNAPAEKVKDSSSNDDTVDALPEANLGNDASNKV